MTKFILHGGVKNSDYSNSQKFFNEITKGVAHPIVLIVNFAAKKYLWPKIFIRQQEQFSQNTKKKINFISASDNPIIFSKQLKQANIIYLRGGRTSKLLKKLKRIKFADLIIGKVVVGSSAGANVLAKYGFSYIHQKIHHGLGILPVKVFPHYSKKQELAFQRLKNYREKLETIKLKEHEYKIIKIPN